MSVISVIDHEIENNICQLSLEKCNELKPCPMHKIIYPLKSKLIENLKSKTIQDFSQEVKSGLAFLPL